MAGFSCPICSESLSKLPAEAAQKNKGRSEHLERDSLNISTTPCGHLFHSYCIQKWLSGTLLSSSKCPCCRKDVPGRSCLPLYPTQYEESFTEDTQNDNTCNHGEELCKLRSKITILEKSLNEKSQLYTLLSNDCADLNKKLITDRQVSEMWMLRAKQYESYKDIVKQQEKEIKELQTTMKTYSEIDKILKGNMDDIELDMHSYPPNEQSIKSLLDTKFALTDELRRSARQLTDSRREKQSYLKEKSALLNKIDHLKKESEEMHKAFANATINPHSTQSRGRLNEHENPKKVFTKRKGASPETSVNGDSIDSDVDLIDSPLPKYKKSQDSKSKTKAVSKNDTINVSSDTDDDFMSPLNFQPMSSIPGLPRTTPPSSRFLTKGTNKFSRGFLHM